MKWKDISLFKFQQIEAINARKIDDLDKILFTTCIVFDKTEYELDNIDPKKANRLITKVSKLFAETMEPEPVKRIGSYKIEYDASKITLGQYVEISHFLQGNPVQNGHYILASITHKYFRKNKSDEHKKKAEYFLKQPITKTVGSVLTFIENFAAFNKEYKALFGLDKETSDEVDLFNKVFGWQFSAREVAADLGITLNEAYALPIREALSSLSYLKAKVQYQERQNKKQANAR